MSSPVNDSVPVPKRFKRRTGRRISEWLRLPVLQVCAGGLEATPVAHMRPCLDGAMTGDLAWMLNVLDCPTVFRC